MAGEIKLQVDSRSFSRALAAYAATTKKDGDLIVNTAAKHLAYRAVETTRHANPSEIAALKRVSSIVVFGKKGRRLKDIAAVSASQRARRTNYAATDIAFMYYLKQRWKAGRSPRQEASRAALKELALRMVNARMSSVHYLRSGWLAAAEKFQDIIKNTSGMRKPQVPRKKANSGGASISTGGKAEAWIWNNSLYSKSEGKVSAALVRYGAEGLQRAMAVSQSKLEQITKERLARAAERFNASK